MGTQAVVQGLGGFSRAICYTQIQLFEESNVTTSRVEMNRKVMIGKLVIRGTRLPIELILPKLGEGASEVDLLDAYLRLTKADIHAAIGYAADTVAHKETVLVGSSSRK